MSIVLHTAPMSSACPVDHAMLELDVPHERVVHDFQAGTQRKPEFLALNPNGKVPTMVVDGTPMFEALAILQWLGDRYGVARKLWPAADSPQRLEALSWTTWAYVSVGAVMARLNMAGSDRSPAELHHAGQVEYCKKELHGLFELLDDRLAKQPYLLGEEFSLADLIVASVITYATYCGAPITDLKHVEDWLSRFQARPAFKQVWG